MGIAFSALNRSPIPLFCVRQPSGAALGVGRNQLFVLLCAGSVLAAFAWSYAPTCASLWDLWSSEADYSHGFFVAPLALSFIWFRRAARPPLSLRLSWPVILLLCCAIAMRFLGRRWNFAALDCWSILPWASAVAWLFGGAAAWRWCLPSIGFLWFMMPLPFRIEQAMSLQLQTVATKASCWTLQTMGQCALAEGHTILLGDERLEIEQACSGLRMVLGAAAMGVACAVLTRRRWWERLLLVGCTLPVALAANVARIVGTGLVKRHWPDTWLADASHDAGGHMMILIAFALFTLLNWYMKQLFYDPSPAEPETVAVASHADVRPASARAGKPVFRTDSSTRILSRREDT